MKLLEVVKHYQGLPHQDKAISNLDKVIDELLPESWVKFTDEWRNDSAKIFNHTIANFPLISQRDNKGDWDKDGTDERYQTCNVTCCAMAIQYLTQFNPGVKELDTLVRTKYGSRYVHSNLVKLLYKFSVKSTFDVNTAHEEIKAALRRNHPVIWSNKLTNGGHIAVIIGYSDDNQYYLIADPFGEPFPTNSARKSWYYRDNRQPYKLSYNSFNLVNANGYNYHGGHWCHICKPI